MCSEFFFSSRRRHTRLQGDWSSDVCSSDLVQYVFGFVNASNAVLNALNNALVYAASQYKVDDILTRDITGFRDTVRRRATQRSEERRVGKECRSRSMEEQSQK